MANCISQPSGVRFSGEAMTPALLTRMCSGPSQAAANDATEARTARSRGATATCLLPVVAMMSSAVCSPALVLRTARVTSAPAPASARAVSIPIPEAPPVTMARRPVRSIPSMTSAAVDSAVNGVRIRWLVAMKFSILLGRPAMRPAVTMENGGPSDLAEFSLIGGTSA